MKGARPARQAGGGPWRGLGRTGRQGRERAQRPARSVAACRVNRSPLARKIITFNLLAMIVLVAGVLYLNPFRDSLVLQRERGLVTEAELIADVFEAQLPDAGPVRLSGATGAAAARDRVGPRGAVLGEHATSSTWTGTLVGPRLADARSAGPPRRRPPDRRPHARSSPTS